MAGAIRSEYKQPVGVYNLGVAIAADGAPQSGHCGET